MSNPTFIIDCPNCKAKVAATESGRAERRHIDHETGEPYGYRLFVGPCPACLLLLVGESTLIDPGGFDVDGYYEEWSEVVRVYPKPARAFSSTRIPRIVKDSLREADRCLQVNANIDVSETPQLSENRGFFP